MLDFSKLFIDVTALPDDGYGVFQLLTIALVYGYILCYASNMISDGSELLLCVPAYAGIVGSIVLPVLGAVPDGCIVLFSGLGPNAQSTLNVGVGALAGSTIMLLTVPWFLSVVGGRVNIENGEAKYRSPKLDPPGFFSLFGTGVAVAPETKRNSIVMVLSAIPFLILQGPAMWYENMSVAKQAVGESGYAFVGFFACVIIFVAYMVYQSRSPGDSEDKSSQRDQVILDAIAENRITLIAVVYSELKAAGVKFEDDSWRDGRSTGIEMHGHQSSSSSSERTPLNGAAATVSHLSAHPSKSHHLIPQVALTRLEKMLKPFFKRYDLDGSGLLDRIELPAVLRDLGERNMDQVRHIQQQFEASEGFKTNGGIDYKEFVRLSTEYVMDHQGCILRMRASASTNAGLRGITPQVDLEGNAEEEDDEEEEEEEEEIPEDLSDLSPDEQQYRIKWRSFSMMAIGTILVLLLSDPMVDVLNEIGTRTKIPAFYVSFVLGPIASNVSEVIASYNYSMKKTTKSMRIAMSTLQGAAVMNNSFVLGIFMLLVYCQSLAWEFFAETLVVLLVQIAVGLMTLKKTHTVFDGLLILSLYPLSLILVASLNAAGWN